MCGLDVSAELMETIERVSQPVIARVLPHSTPADESAPASWAQLHRSGTGPLPDAAPAQLGYAVLGDHLVHDVLDGRRPIGMPIRCCARAWSGSHRRSIYQ